MRQDLKTNNVHMDAILHAQLVYVNYLRIKYIDNKYENIFIKARMKSLGTTEE